MTTLRQWFRFAFSLTLALSLCQCSFLNKRADYAGKDGSGPGDDDGNPTTDSLEAFKQTVYPLVRGQTCVGCHQNTVTPFFAAESPEEAHAAILEAKKVDFVTPDNSRMVIRLKSDKHNCWTACENDAAEMLEAIQKWQGMIASNNEPQDLGIVTTPMSISEAREKEPEESSIENAIMIESESATLTNPMVIVNDAMASGGKYIHTPVVANGTKQANAANGGVATFTFNATEAGNYFLWGLVNAPTANDNSFYARVDNTQFRQWRTTDTAGQWEWDLASDQDEGGNIISFNLTAGAHTLQIREREDGFRIDMIALTTDANFTPPVLNEGPAMALTYDLSSLLGGVSAKLEIEVKVFDDFSYKFKNPKLITDRTSIHIKNLRIAINGKYDPQNATYTVIDQTVDAPGAILSGSSLIIPKDKGEAEDQISVAFEVLEAK